MEAISTIILSAAKAIGVSGALLLGICQHESGDFKQNYVPFDMGSPSFGSCQLKYSTGLFLNFHGNPYELNEPKVNALYAAKYLRWQQSRYNDNWVKMVAAYNSGSYNPSKIILGCPRNLRYIKAVRAKLPQDLQERLNCGTSDEFAEAE